MISLNDLTDIELMDLTLKYDIRISEYNGLVVFEKNPNDRDITPYEIGDKSYLLVQINDFFVIIYYVGGMELWYSKTGLDGILTTYDGVLSRKRQ